MSPTSYQTAPPRGGPVILARGYQLASGGARPPRLARYTESPEESCDRTGADLLRLRLVPLQAFAE